MLDTAKRIEIEVRRKFVVGVAARFSPPLFLMTIYGGFLDQTRSSLKERSASMITFEIKIGT